MPRVRFTDDGYINYPPPQENPKCHCPTSMQAFFCSTGHMLECHYPMNCEAARCSHLRRYLDEVAEDEEAE